MHDGDQRGFRAQSAADIGGIDDAARAGSDARHFDAFALKLSTRTEHGGMFDSAGDDMARTVGGAHDAQDREIIGFGAAGGESQFLGIAPDQRGDLPACEFEPLLRKLSEVVNARGVTIHLTKTKRHRFQRFGSDGSCCVMVEIVMRHVVLF